MVYNVYCLLYYFCCSILLAIALLLILLLKHKYFYSIKYFNCLEKDSYKIKAIMAEIFYADFQRQHEILLTTQLTGQL